MDWNKICESAIAGSFISFGVVIANRALDLMKENKEFHSNLALIVLELYNNYFLIPESNAEFKKVIFETTAWDNLKSKFALKLPDKLMVRTETLYYNFKNHNLSKEILDEFDYICLKGPILDISEELRKESKYKFKPLLKLEEFRQAIKGNDNGNVTKPKL